MYAIRSYYVAFATGLFKVKAIVNLVKERESEDSDQ